MAAPAIEYLMRANQDHDGDEGVVTLRFPSQADAEAFIERLILSGLIALPETSLQ